jgi:hypothetical protein
MESGSCLEGKTKHEELMARYLLGELAEEERITIEERFFTDYDYFEELLSVEGTLLDDYLAGKLSDSQVERIRGNLLASRFQLQELELNRDVIETARQLPLRPEEKSETLETSPTPPVANNPASTPASRAVERRLSEAPLAQIAGWRRPALAMTLAAMAAVFAFIALASAIYFWRELTTLREQYANVARQNEEIMQSIEPPALLLIPSSQHRSEGDQPPPTIKVRSWMQAFTLKLKIDDRSHRRYSAQIEKVGQKITDPPIWKSEFGIENINEQGQLDLTLAARDFEAAGYMATVKGLDADRKLLTLYYYFEVKR